MRLRGDCNSSASLVGISSLLIRRDHPGTMGESVSELPGGFVESGEGGRRNGIDEIGTGQLERAMKSVPTNDATPSSSPSATPENARPHYAADGERRQITVLFADVVGFTAFAERFGDEASYSLMKRVSGLLTE